MKQWKVEEILHNFYSSPSIIRMINSKKRLAGHVAGMSRRGMYTRFWWEPRKRPLGRYRNRSEDNVKVKVALCLTN
jgi:hypothetical protein